MKVFLLRKIIYKNPAAIRTYDDGNRNDIGYPSGSCNNPTTSWLRIYYSTISPVSEKELILLWNIHFRRVRKTVVFASFCHIR